VFLLLTKSEQRAAYATLRLVRPMRFHLARAAAS
jgi:hypothetical protein